MTVPPTEQLFLAIRQEDHETLRQLIANDPNLLTARDQRGSTPLVLATYLGNLPATRILVEAGADPNAPDASGNTPLLGVCFKGYREIAAYLLASGADVHARGVNDFTALKMAEMGKQEAMIGLLREAGAK